MVNILVTGGAGYTRSNSWKMLVESGFTAVSFDNLSTGHREVLIRECVNRVI